MKEACDQQAVRDNIENHDFSLIDINKRYKIRVLVGEKKPKMKTSIRPFSKKSYKYEYIDIVFYICDIYNSLVKSWKQQIRQVALRKYGRFKSR